MTQRRGKNEIRICLQGNQRKRKTEAEASKSVNNLLEAHQTSSTSTTFTRNPKKGIIISQDSLFSYLARFKIVKLEILLHYNENFIEVIILFFFFLISQIAVHPIYIAKTHSMSNFKYRLYTTGSLQISVDFMNQGKFNFT